MKLDCFSSEGGNLFFRVINMNKWQKIILGVLAILFVAVSVYEGMFGAGMKGDTVTYRNDTYSFELEYPNDWMYELNEYNTPLEGTVRFMTKNRDSNIELNVVFSSVPIENDGYCLEGEDHKGEVGAIDGYEAVWCTLSLDPDADYEGHVFGYEGDLGTKIFLSKDDKHHYMMHYIGKDYSELGRELDEIFFSFRLID